MTDTVTTITDCRPAIQALAVEMEQQLRRIDGAPYSWDDSAWVDANRRLIVGRIRLADHATLRLMDALLRSAVVAQP